MMDKIRIIIVPMVIIMFVLYFGKNIVAKKSFSGGVRIMTGLELSMKSVNVGIFKTLIGITELQLFNPPGFVDKLMVDMPEIYVDYDLGAFINGKVHLEETRLDLKEFSVIKNEKGELNLDSLRVVEEKKEGKVEGEEEKIKMPELQIDVLELKIGKVVYKDYSKGTPPKVREFNVNIDERFENITNPRTLISLIIVKALKNTAIARLTNFNLGALQEGVAEKLKETTKKVVETSDKAIETGRDLEKKVKDTARETIEKATDTIKKILPFGK
ncbi:MAG: hypothetical protein ACE5GU_14625 [Candidatus Scalinduaceae bacterium]